jgi:hypothetical protein
MKRWKERGQAHLPYCKSSQSNLDTQGFESDSTLLTCSKEGGLAPAASFEFLCALCAELCVLCVKSLVLI